MVWIQIEVEKVRLKGVGLEDRDETEVAKIEMFKF